MTKNIAFLIITLLYSSISFGQQRGYQDVIKLKNGSVIKGTVIEIVEDDYVKILMGGRQTLLFYFEEISYLRDANYNIYSHFVSRKGFFNTTQLGLNIDVIEDQFLNHIVTYFSFHSVNGYRVNRFINLGIGLGLDYYSEYTTVPVYFTIKGEIFKGIITPFYQIGIGNSFAWQRQRSFWNRDNVKGGLFINPGGGFQINLNNKAIIFGISYKIQKVQSEFIGFNSETVEKKSLRNLSLALGIMF